MNNLVLDDPYYNFASDICRDNFNLDSQGLNSLRVLHSSKTGTGFSPIIPITILLHTFVGKILIWTHKG